MANMYDQDEIYKASLRLREGELNRLFQRVNFFLISTAFLIAALATLITSKNFVESIPLQGFAYLLTVVGLSLSILFTASNYLNDRTIRKLWEKIKDIEADYPPQPSLIIWLDTDTKNEKLKLTKVICELFEQLRSVRHHPFSALGGSKMVAVPHTWLIPFGFIFFWVGAIAFIPFINGCYLAGWIILGLGACAFICTVVMILLPEGCYRHLKLNKCNRDETN
jgi:hypothetical protein